LELVVVGLPDLVFLYQRRQQTEEIQYLAPSHLLVVVEAAHIPVQQAQTIPALLAVLVVEAL
jgi:hypothetical protein